MKIEQIPTEKLIPYARNAKKHDAAQVSKLAGSIREFGFNNPVLIDKDNGIIAGHGRVMAAQKLELKTVPCIRLGHLTDTQRKAYILADNRLAEVGGGWDEEILKLELADLGDLDFDLDSIGFGAEDLAEREMEEETEKSDADAEPQIDKAEELRAKWGVEPGQLWELGDHRLLCGDSTKKEDVERVMGGEQINIAFTSPPYASQRKYDEASGFKPIPPEDFVQWFNPIAANVKQHLAKDGSWFVNIKPACEGLMRLTYVFDLVLAHVRQWGWNFAEEFCWERTGIPQQVVRRFKNQFEPIYQFTLGEWKIRPDAVRHESDSVPKAMGRGAGDTNAARRQGFASAVEGNQIESGLAYPGNRLAKFQSEALGHSAAFPVGLPSFFVKAFTDERDTVYEPFSGSGTTIMACEQLGRKCRAIEISPGYVAVALQRWADATGKEPRKL
jgi:DNA modification methylase